MTILPNDLHDIYKMKISTGARWTFLSDAELEVQRTLDIHEYTDPHHAATRAAHAGPRARPRDRQGLRRLLVLGPPVDAQLWADLGDLHRRSSSPRTPRASSARSWAGLAFDHDHEGDCGIYNVATLAPARRRGLAAGLTARLLQAAKARGCTSASLQSTPIAERV